MILFATIAIPFLFAFGVAIFGIWELQRTKRIIANVGRDAILALNQIPVPSPLPTNPMLPFNSELKLTNLYRLFNESETPQFDQLANCLNRDEIRWQASMENGHVHVVFEKIG